MNFLATTPSHHIFLIIIIFFFQEYLDSVQREEFIILTSTVEKFQVWNWAALLNWAYCSIQNSFLTVNYLWWLGRRIGEMEDRGRGWMISTENNFFSCLKENMFIHHNYAPNPLATCRNFVTALIGNYWSCWLVIFLYCLHQNPAKS